MAFGRNELEVLMRIGGDSSGAKKALGSLDSTFKSTAKVAAAAFKVVAAATAAATGALAVIVKQTTEAADRLDKMSKRTGESVENLSRLEYAANITGTSIEQLEKGVNLLNRRIVDADRGLETYERTFRELGITTRDTSGSLKSATDVLLEFADWAGKTNDQTRLTAYAMELFGRSGAELIPLLKEGRGGIEQLMEKADELGITMSTKTARAGAELKDRMTDLKMSLAGLRNTLATELLPIVSKYVTKIVEWIRAHKEVIKEKVKAFIEGVATALQKAWKFLKEHKDTLIAIAKFAAAAFAVAKIYAFGKAVGKVVPALAGTLAKAAKSGALLKTAIAGVGIAVAAWSLTKVAELIGLLKEASEVSRDMEKSSKTGLSQYKKYVDGLRRIKNEYTDRGGDWIKFLSEHNIDSPALMNQLLVPYKAGKKNAEETLEELIDTYGTLYSVQQKYREAAKSDPLLDRLLQEQSALRRKIGLLRAERDTLKAKIDLEEDSLKSNQLSTEEKKKAVRELGALERQQIENNRQLRLAALKQDIYYGDMKKVDQAAAEKKITENYQKEIAKQKQIEEQRLAEIKRDAKSASGEAARASEEYLARSAALNAEISQMNLEQLQAALLSEELNFDERRAIAERLSELELAEIEKRKAAELKANAELLENGKIKAAEKARLDETATQKFKQETDAQVAAHKERLAALSEAEKQATQQRIQEQIEANRSVAESEIKSLELRLKTENLSKDEQIKIAKQIRDVKLKLLLTEIELKKKALQAMGKLDEAELKKIETTAAEIRYEIEAEYDAAVTAAKNSMSAISEGLIDFADDVIRISDQISNSIAGVISLFGGDPGGFLDVVGNLQDAFGSATTAIVGFMEGDILSAVQGAIGAVGSLVGAVGDVIDAVTESYGEGLEKQWERQGVKLKSELPQELIDRMEAVSDAKANKNYGIKAYLEEVFTHLDLSNQKTYTQAADWVNEAIDEQIRQGKSTEEVYAQFGDELEQLRKAQEQYGFEMSDSMKKMLAQQRLETKEGRVGGLKDAVSGLDIALTAMSKYDFSQESFSGVFGMMQGAYQRLAAEGLTLSEIQAIVGPTVEKAIKTAEEKGLDTSAMQEVKAFYEKMARYGDLFDVISGVGDAVKALAETGNLSQENLDQSATAALETYHKLLDQGFTQEQVLSQIGPQLQELILNAEQYGFTIPEELAGIGQAIVEGGFGKEVSVPEKIDELGQIFEEVIGKLGDRFEKAFSAKRNSTPSFFRGGPIGNLSGGGGSDEVTINAHEGEYVMGVEAVRRLGRNTIERINRTGVLPITAVPVPTPVEQAPIRQAISEVRGVADEMRRERQGFIREVAENIKDGIAAAIPQAGKTVVDANVNLNGQPILKFLQESLNNGSLMINANAIKVV